MKHQLTILSCLIVLITNSSIAQDAIHSRSIESIKTNLDSAVGGVWDVQHYQSWMFLYPKVLPRGLESGTYEVFISDTNHTALSYATTMMEICQAPFFILGTNTDCVVITYIRREHPVSRAIVKTLGLIFANEKGFLPDY